MQLLLDTNALIFAAEAQLKPSAATLLSQRFASREAVLISPISGWELGLLFSWGRLRSPLQPREYWRRMTTLSGIGIAPLTGEIMLESSFLPGAPPHD
ncbi:MAG TPA: VapC toxin family PIN domain ribonuclease, partial [Alphaproteobacteria bacterium]|nr:VapC toxin family PIN domain ribonuclease [Alphaproteobacteria bacterium]